MGKSFTNEIEERVLSIEERENVRPVDTKQAETLRARTGDLS